MANDLSRPDLLAAAHGSAEPDVALVAAALRDRQQFARLYERYANRLFRYALARTGSRQVADDVVSDTMVAAMESLDRYNPSRGSVVAWLFTIAARRIADRQRAQGRFRRVMSRLVHVDTAEDTATQIIRGDDAARVNAALAALSEAERELVLLRYSAELNSTQIGEVLGITPGAVRMRLSRTLDRLAIELGTDDE
jgi:RNA polymerase sigma-70 factor (ECF subfamily)